MPKTFISIFHSGINMIPKILLIIFIIGLSGCFDDIITNDIFDDPGEIIMNQTGGIAGFSRTIKIGKEKGVLSVAFIDNRTNERRESRISREDLKLLWQTLEENDIFDLATNHTLVNTVMDGFFYDVKVKRGDNYNRFSVYVPDLLVDNGEKRYKEVVEAISSFADDQLNATGIQGTVTNERGIPVVGSRVWIVSGTASFPKIIAYTNEKGYYKILGVPAGTFKIGVHDEQGNSIDVKSVNVRDGRISTLNFVIPNQPGDFIIEDLPINDVDINLMESFPVQISLVIKGYLKDSCTKLNEITQKLDGNTIYVHITTKRPKDAMCALVITEIKERVSIKGGFLPGHYKLVVNDFVKEFDI